MEELWELSARGDEKAREELINRQVLYWKNRDQKMLAALNAFSAFLDTLNKGIGTMRQEFEALAKE